MEIGTSFAALDLTSEERFVTLRKELGVTTFGLNQLNLMPGDASRIHRHRRQEEVYIVLEGELTLSVEGEEYTMPVGSAARVAPDARRQLINRGDIKLVFLALGGAEEHNGRDGEAFASWADEAPSEPRDVPFPERGSV